MKIQQYMVTALATGSLLMTALTPLALADTSLQVSGNGAGSSSAVSSNTASTSTLVQDNSATVTNTVSSNTNTGNNTSNDNTGGNVTVDTGNALSTTSIQNRLNANVADLSNGCNSCNTGNSTVTLSGNGANSLNRATVTNTNTSQTYQTNHATVSNNVSSQENTGNNDASRNTGGDVLVLTGNAGSATNLSTAANANVAQGSLGGNGGTGNTDVRVSGNGYASDNSVSLQGRNTATVVQDNYANVRNQVRSDLTTGNNQANENTGGNVTVDTGNALSQNNLQTMANFNSADMGNCGCTTNGITAKIAGNGAYSRNRVFANMLNSLSAFQGANGGNNAQVYNDVYSQKNTGNNNTNRNTGAIYNDPLNSFSGYAQDTNQVQTAVNANVLGSNGIQLPGGTNLNFTFDLNGLLNGFGM